MQGTRNILLAVDESESSVKAAEYVGRMLQGMAGVGVEMAHVLPPMPPDLLEWGGAEDPKKEVQMEARLHRVQQAWVEKECEKTGPVMQRLVGILRAHGWPTQAVHTHACTSVNRGDLVPDLLELAEALDCGTIVVGRGVFTGWHKLLGHHVSDQLVRHAKDVTVWVVAQGGG